MRRASHFIFLLPRCLLEQIKPHSAGHDAVKELFVRRGKHRYSLVVRSNCPSLSDEALGEGEKIEAACLQHHGSTDGVDRRRLLSRLPWRRRKVAPAGGAGARCQARSHWPPARISLSVRIEARPLPAPPTGSLLATSRETSRARDSHHARRPSSPSRVPAACCVNPLS
ncbi:hypothetical protein MRX96_026968 [Rhipicephalus microplus]